MHRRWSLRAALYVFPITAIVLVLGKDATSNWLSERAFQSVHGEADHDIVYLDDRRIDDWWLTLHGGWVRRQGSAFLLHDNPAVTDAGVEQLARPGTNIDALRLDGTSVTGECLAQFRDLHSLGLSNTKITHRGLSVLGSKEVLEELGLANTGVDDRAVETLTKLRRLVYLDIRDTGISGAGVRRIVAACPRLNTICVSSKAVGPECVADLASQRPMLEIQVDRP